MADTAPELHDAYIIGGATSLVLLKHLRDSNVEFGPYETALDVASMYQRLGIAEYRRLLVLGVGHKEMGASSRLHNALLSKIAELHGTDAHFDDRYHLLSQLSSADMNRIVAAIPDISDGDAGYMAYVAMYNPLRLPATPSAPSSVDRVKAFIEEQKRITRFLPASVITQTDVNTYEGTKQYPLADEELVGARIATIVRKLALIVQERVTVDVQPGYQIKIATGTAPGATNYDKRLYDGGMQGAAELNLSEQTILEDGLRILKREGLKGIKDKTVLTIKNGLTDREVVCTDYVGNAKRRIDSGDTESFTGYDLRHNWDVTAVPKENTDA